MFKFTDLGLNHRESFERLLNHCFPVPPGASFFDDFPIWDPARGPSGVHRLGVFEEGELIGCAGYRMAELKLEGMERARVGLIGAVATSISARGRGVASALALEATLRAEREGARACMLWGGEHSLYGRIGYAPAGKQRTYTLGGGSLSPRASEVVRTDWTRGLMKCFESREGGTLVTPSDERWIEAHKSVDWFWVGDPAQPTGYAAIGRGIDLPGFVHEWGGEASALSRVLGHVLALHPGALVLAAGDPPAGLSLPLLEEGALCLARGEPELLKRDFWFWGLDAV